MTAIPTKSFLMQKLIIALSFFAVLTSILRAEITGEIQSLSVTNSSNVLYASDANNAGILYDRNAIRVESISQFTQNGATPSYDFQFRYQLIDESGTVVPLKVGGGVADYVSVVRIISGSTGPLTDSASLVPSVQLVRGETYRVTISLWEKENGMLIPFEDTGVSLPESPGRQWVHFTHLVSGDVPYNVLPLVSSVSWEQPWAIGGSDTQDSFELATSWNAYRYDDFGQPVANDDITFRLSVELRRTSDDSLVPLEQSSFDVVESMSSYIAEIPNTIPSRARVVGKTTTLSLKPQVQLASSSEAYYAIVKIGHFETPGAGFPVVNSVAAEVASEQLMHFNGVIRFGDAAGNFGSIAIPAPQAVVPGVDGLPVIGLRIDGQSGMLPGFPGATFGSGSPLSVTLEDDGDAVLSGGSVNVVEPAEEFAEAGDLRYELQNVALTPGGATADIGLLLPAGLGWTSDPELTRIWESELVFTGHSLTSEFGLSGGSLSLPNFVGWFSEESKPVWFEVSQVDWNVAQSSLNLTTTGEVEFVRGAELTDLLNDGDLPLTDRTKRSNDHVFQVIDGVSASVLIDADSVGTALMTADFTFVSGVFRTHFPYDALLSWNGNGLLKVVQDEVDTSLSVLNSPAALTNVQYAQDCDDIACLGAQLPKKALNFSGGGEPFRFTKTGGISGVGSLASSEKLQWGKIELLNKFAHETSEFGACALHVPGGFSRRIPGIPSGELPASILHAGHDPADGSLVRPGTVDFENGRGNYAGLNFRTTGGGFTGTSVLAGSSAGPYDLSSRCQYIARFAGITGIHEATTGTFPESALLAGYPVQFDDFGIQLIHSEVTDSRTKGELSLPQPAGFSVAYDKMFFTCLGSPSALEIDPAETDADKVLSYWQADFRAKVVSFVPLAGGACDPSSVRLSVAVEAWSSEIPEPLFGTLGFLPNGQIMTGADEETEPAIDSRLTLPPTISIDGPGEERWAASTVGGAYFNHAVAAPNEVGWLNIAAKLDLPFFEDSPVHLHTRCRKNDENQIVYVMGGFRDPNESFSISGENYFTQEPFDTGHRGYALGVSLAEYREGLGGDDGSFQMRAQTRWLDVIDLDYTMKWEPGTRTFSKYKDTKASKFFILSLDHRCNRLTPENADLDFGASAGLQKLSLTELASGQVSELFDVLQDEINEEVFTNGRAAIEELLEPTMRGLFARPVQDRLDAKADDVLAILLADWNAGSKEFNDPINKGALLAVLNQSDLAGAYQDIAGASAEAAGLLKEVKDRLIQARMHIEDFREYSKPGPGNKFDSIATTAKRLAGKASDKLDNPAYAEDVEALIESIKPVLLELDKLAEKAEDTCDDLINALDGNGTLATELKEALSEAQAELDSAVDGVAGELNGLLKPLRPGIDDFASASEQAELREKLRNAMADQFFSTSATATVQNILKQRVYDLEQRMRLVVDGVFEQADEAARELIKSVLGGVDEKLAAFLGDAAGVMAGAEVKGKAHIRGESLTDLRLDLKVELNVSDKMKAHVFVEIKELNSENTPGACLPKGMMGTEVTMGAEEVALEWVFPDTSASFNTKFQFDSEGKLTGLGGALEILGEIGFGEQLVINEMGCAVMIGEEEFYISAEVSLTASGVTGKGGVFFGKTCTLDPFFWDPTIEAALGEPSFTGAYAYGEAHIPLNQILGIPSSCLLNLTAGAGQGYGLFAEGPTAIGKIFYALHGEVLCILSVTGEVSLVGAVNVGQLKPTLVGQGVLKGELGYCPLCVSIEKTLTLKFKDNKLSYDLK